MKNLHSLKAKHIIICFFFFLLISQTISATTFTVTNTNASGTGSLYAAINSANTNNNNPTVDIINFAITGTGPFTITPTSAFLLTITNPVTINGYSQSGSVDGVVGGSPVPVLKIILNGGGTIATGLSFTTSASGSTVRGLVIERFTVAGINLGVTNCTINENYIGVNATGTSALGNLDGIVIGATGNIITSNLISGNTHYGIKINSASAQIKGNLIGVNGTGTASIPNTSDGIYIGQNNAIIGGSTATDRNIISGNGGNGIDVALNANPTTIKGNYIGLNISGAGAVANALNGIYVNSQANVTIGSGTAGEGNVISGNTQNGIFEENGGNIVLNIKGNFIGTNAAGNAAVGNGFNGILINLINNGFIGSATAGQGNVIGGNTQYGIKVQAGNDNSIKGNFIGTNTAGTIAIGNGLGGIYILSNSNRTLIGGTATGEGNTIANTINGHGILIDNSNFNPIRKNTIFCNSLNGIKLTNGGNGSKATPTIDPSSTSSNLFGTAASGDLVDIYTNHTCSACPAQGQGKTFIATVTATTGGTWAYTSGISGNLVVSATTPVVNTSNTSEFSLCKTVCPSPAPVPSVSISITAGSNPSCSGNSVTFTAVPTWGGTAPTYQWKKNSIAIQGATNAIYTTTSLINNDTITCTLTSNDVCVSQQTATSSSIKMTINTAPVISSQPANSIICPTTNTSFTVAATGASLTYQWQLKVGTGSFTNISNGGVYSGAITATLTITNATSGLNTNQYRCIVTGSCTPTATSNAAILTILTTCTCTFTAVNGTSYTVTTGQTICINSGVTYSTGTITLNGGTILIKVGGTLDGARVTFGTTSSRTINNFGTLTWSNVANIDIAAGTSTNFLTINNYAGGVFATNHTIANTFYIRAFNQVINYGLMTFSANLVNNSMFVLNHASVNLLVNGNLTNTGTVNMSNATGSLIVNGNLINQSGATTLTLSNFTGGLLNLYGNFTNDAPFTGNKGAVYFDGSVNQVVSGSSVILIDTLYINKTSSGTVTLNRPVEIKSLVNFTNGILFTTSTNILTFNNGAVVKGASINNFVSGAVKKIGNAAFTFPIGKPAFYQPLSITAPALATDAFTAEYFRVPQTYGMSVDPTINYISACDYFIFNRTAGTSTVTPTVPLINCLDSLYPQAHMIGWNGTTWKDLGISNFNSNLTSNINISAGAPLTTYGPIALGRVASTATDPLTLLKNAGPCGAIYISEYVQSTTNNNTAIEIYNPTANPINLTNYYITGTSNGDVLSPPFTVNLSGTIGAYQTFVIANRSADAALRSKANMLSDSLKFNGKDMVALAYISTGIYFLDKIGDFFNIAYTDTGWTVGNGSTLNHTLYRNSNITRGNTDWSTCKDEWTVYPKETFTYLGEIHASDCDPNSPQQADSLSWYRYGQLVTYTTQPDVYSYTLIPGTQPCSYDTSLVETIQADLNLGIVNVLLKPSSTISQIKAITKNLKSNSCFQKELKTISQNKMDNSYSKWITLDDRVTVVFKDANITSKQVKDFAKKYKVKIIMTPSANRLAGTHGIYMFQLKSGADTTSDRLAKAMWEADSLNLLAVEPNFLNYIHVNTSCPTNDTYFTFSQQCFLWHLKNDGTLNNSNGSQKSTSGADAKVCDCWSAGYTGAGIKIAVIDIDGFEWTHEDLAGQFINGWDCTRPDSLVGQPYTSSTPLPPYTGHYHGTSVSSTAVAGTNNNKGIAGVSPDAKVMPILVNANGATMSLALNKVLELHADIVNMSFEVPDYSPWHKSITNDWPNGRENPYSQGTYLGIIGVASAGNKNGDSLQYPAGWDEVIGVIGTNPKDFRHSGSDGWGTAGVGSSYGFWYDVAAPGAFNFVASYMGKGQSYLGGNYDNTGGTSFSSPIVAGIAAILLQKNYGLTKQQVVNAILNNTDKVQMSTYGNYNDDPVNYPGQSREMGHGRVNCLKALNAITVGINEVSEKVGTIKVISPADDNLTILYYLNDNVKEVQAKIYDITGRQLTEARLLSENNTSSIDVSKMARGMYIVVFYTKDGHFIQSNKFVK